MPSPALVLDIFVILPCTKFHIPSSKDSLVISMKPEAKEYVLNTTMLFYIPQKYGKYILSLG
jgi:hypothetical protein